jgi:hypothetical protein
MSRRDLYHEIVRKALIREGWTITHDPYIINSDPKLAVDMGAERIIAAKREQNRIAVEIKSFVRASQVVDLHDAVGQYAIYDIFLRKQEPERLLYLAVPIHAFENILSREVGQVIVSTLKINLLVYSLSEKEPLIWKKQ